MRVLREVVDEVPEVDIEHVADGDDLGEADLLGGRPVDDRGRERSRLRGEGDVAIDRHRLGEAGVEPEARHDEPETVGPQQPHPLMARQLLADEPLELGSLGTGFPEAGREDRDRRHAPLTAGAHDVGHRGRGGADDREIRSGRRLGDARVGLDAADRLASGVDRVDNPVETAIDEVPQDDVTELGGLTTGADDRDAVGAEKVLEVVDAHEQRLRLE